MWNDYWKVRFGLRIKDIDFNIFVGLCCRDLSGNMFKKLILGIMLKIIEEIYLF